MTILYALVARGKTVLSEFTFTSGNFPTITRLLLGRIDMSRNGKMSYIYDQYVFHYICEDGLRFLCMCDFLRRCNQEIFSKQIYFEEEEEASKFESSR